MFSEIISIVKEKKLSYELYTEDKDKVNMLCISSYGDETIDSHTLRDIMIICEKKEFGCYISFFDKQLRIFPYLPTVYEDVQL